MGIRLSARYQWEDTDSPPLLDKTFAGPRLSIGNDPAASLCLNGSVLAAEQIVIIDEETSPQLINQADGTSLNGEVLELGVCRPLRNGDVLCVGTYRIDIFFDEGPNAQHPVTPVVPQNGDAGKQIAGNSVAKFLPPTETATDANHRPRSSKSFAAILDSLRTDEDRFYFVIDSGAQSGVRVPIECEQMPLGWDETNEHLCFDISQITDLCAIAHKDWSGVILGSQAGAIITVNDETLAGERRLRDGDRIVFTGSKKPPGWEESLDGQVVLVFREPTSLVILDSLMPRVPPPRDDAAIASAERAAVGASSRFDPQRLIQQLSALIKSDKEYFSAFTAVELSLMAIGTIVGAVIIFLILNYS